MFQCLSDGRDTAIDAREPLARIGIAARTVTLRHRHVLPEINAQIHTRLELPADYRANLEPVHRRCALLRHRHNGALTRLRRDTANALNVRNRRICHDNLDLQALAALRPRAHQPKVLVLRVDNHHMRLFAAPFMTAHNALDVVHNDIRADARLFAFAVDVAADIGLHAEHAVSAGIVRAAEPKRVLDDKERVFARRVERIALARIIADALHRAALAVHHQTLDAELAEGAAAVARTVNLADVGAVDFGAHTRKVAVAVNRRAIFGLAHHLDFAARATVEIVLTRNLAFDGGSGLAENWTLV